MIAASPLAYPSGMLTLEKGTDSRGGDRMRFYTTQHPLYCGIDLHARTMSVCIMNHDGEIVLHKNMQAGPGTVSQGDCLLPRRSGRGGRMSLHLVLARRPLCPRGYGLRAGACPLHAGDPRRPSQKRPERFAKDCRVTPRWHAAPGLRLSGGDACHPRLTAADASEAETRGALGACPQYP
jgi:hypothetical protein